MITFPNAKINIGLNVTEKRPDGYHNLETVFFPVPWCDVLEFVEAGAFAFTTSGLMLGEEPEQNLVVRAYRLMQERYDLPPIHIHLHKNIPAGAGLGGGSSDAAFMLSMLNQNFQLGLTSHQLMELAGQLGSDCPFFILNTPCFATQRGDRLEPIRLDLASCYLAIVKPPFAVSTVDAFRNIVPAKSRLALKALVKFPIGSWKENVFNQFERSVFPLHPELTEIKQQMFQSGAVYASMSGSGSAVYGIFRTEPTKIKGLFPDDYTVFLSRL